MSELRKRDFRIGNFIQSRTGQICVIEEIQEDGISAYSGSITTLPYKTIELTEDWLLKFGFSDISEDYDDVEKCYILESNTCRNYSVIKVRGVWMFGYEFEDFNTEIKHIHQLQNLYFALVGEELKIIQNDKT